MPKPGWDGLRVWFPGRITPWMSRLGLGDQLESLRKTGVRLEPIRNRPGKYAFLFRPSLLRDIPEQVRGSVLHIYSMWSGYLRRPDWREALLHPMIGRMEQVHASGHAAVSDLAWLCERIRPKMVAPNKPPSSKLRGIKRIKIYLIAKQA